MLERAGHRVSEAETGHEVVEQVAHQAFDLVLMDLGMPGIDGLEAARRIRTLPAPAGRVPIVAVSGYATEEDRERCLEAGMNAFLGKPYRMRELLGALASALGAAAPQVPSETSPDAGLPRSEFLASAREDVRQIAEAASKGNRAAVRRLAHGLAGAAAIWGFDDVLALARRIHAAAEDASLGEIDRLVAALRAAAAREEGEPDD